MSSDRAERLAKELLGLESSHPSLNVAGKHFSGKGIDAMKNFASNHTALTVLIGVAVVGGAAAAGYSAYRKKHPSSQ